MSACLARNYPVSHDSVKRALHFAPLQVASWALSPANGRVLLGAADLTVLFVDMPQVIRTRDLGKCQVVCF